MCVCLCVILYFYSQYVKLWSKVKDQEAKQDNNTEVLLVAVSQYDVVVVKCIVSSYSGRW